MSSSEYLARLASQHRIMLLGGVAVILHGLSRSTNDIDVWLDPILPFDEWVGALRTAARGTQFLPSMVDLATGIFRPTQWDDVRGIVAANRFIRVNDPDRPIDVFREPRNMTPSDFDKAWSRSLTTRDGLHYLDPVDLILTKYDTGRPHDEADIQFLEHKVNELYRAQLLQADAEEARRLLERFATPALAYFAATKGRADDTRAYAEIILKQMADDGDPFAQDLMRELLSRR